MCRSSSETTSGRGKRTPDFCQHSQVYLTSRNEMMTESPVCFWSVRHCLCLFSLLIVLYASGANGDDGNFFLKASKNVPRIGRRSEYDNFFLKASKNVPRIGRRREMAPLTEGRDWGAWPWYRTADSIPGPSRRSDYYIHEEGETQPLSWATVERTMEEAPELWKPELWRKLAEEMSSKDIKRGDSGQPQD